MTQMAKTISKSYFLLSGRDKPLPKIADLQGHVLHLYMAIVAILQGHNGSGAGVAKERGYTHGIDRHFWMRVERLLRAALEDGLQAAGICEPEDAKPAPIDRS